MKPKTQFVINMVFTIIALALSVLYAIDGNWFCFIVEGICTLLFGADSVISFKNI